MILWECRVESGAMRNRSRILVTDDEGRLLGMLTLRDLMDLLTLKLQLEDGS